jgi:hypothetical protein
MNEVMLNPFFLTTLKGDNMAIEVITSWTVLIQKAKAVGKAKISGDKNALANAEKELRDYEEVVKQSDRMTLSIRRGQCY